MAGRKGGVAARKRVDPQSSQSGREALAQRLTLDTDAPSIYVHTELFNDLLCGILVCISRNVWP